MITAQILFLILPLIMGNPGQSRDSSLSPCRISTLECSILRKHSYLGFTKVAQGRFCYDATSGKIAYEYRGPFHYRFILSDSTVCGIDTKSNCGYALRRGADSLLCDGLYLSIHLLDSYLRSVNADAASYVLRGSIGPFLYYERKNRLGSDIFSVERISGRIVCVESFDPQGKLYEQARMMFDSGKESSQFPSEMIVRTLYGGVLTADTIIISGVSVNRAVSGELFSLPAGHKLSGIGGMPADGGKE